MKLAIGVGMVCLVGCGRGVFKGDRMWCGMRLVSSCTMIEVADAQVIRSIYQDQLDCRPSAPNQQISHSL